MPRPRAGVKYGTAHSCRIFTCPSNHIHIIGEDEQGLPEYEVVLGEKMFPALNDALNEAWRNLNAPTE